MCKCEVEKRFLFFRWTVVEHDWEVIETSHKNYVEHNVYLEKKPIGPIMPASPPFSNDGYLVNRICLSCGERDFQIDDYRAAYRASIARKKLRQRRALEVAGANQSQ